MNTANTNPSHRNAGRRRLPVEWLERPGALPVVLHAGAITRNKPPIRPCSRRNTSAFSIQPLAFSIPRSARGFTILEMLLVVGIIGLLASMALPHLGGITKGNAMNIASRQMLDDIGQARQRALVNRSAVCMVFLPPSFWTNDIMTNAAAAAAALTNASLISLASHQYAAYAVVSLRSVGDQPGRAYPHYLTDWKFLPQGVFISPILFTNLPAISFSVSTTNTTINLSNGWTVAAFPTNISFPFPSAYFGMSNNLPYIEFNANGQLVSSVDQFIMLASGSIFYPRNADGSPNFSSAADLIETPPGNDLTNPNLIHIDCVTGRAKIERNQF